MRSARRTNYVFHVDLRSTIHRGEYNRSNWSKKRKASFSFSHRICNAQALEYTWLCGGIPEAMRTIGNICKSFVDVSSILETDFSSNLDSYNIFRRNYILRIEKSPYVKSLIISYLVYPIQCGTILIDKGRKWVRRGFFAWQTARVSKTLV